DSASPNGCNDGKYVEKWDEPGRNEKAGR
ncbi:MAG: hypothetical protein US60_C0037G0014, partial [Microgenomates group bacterium GW2011_GWC1_37_8]